MISQNDITITQAHTGYNAKHKGLRIVNPLNEYKKEYNFVHMYEYSYLIALCIQYLHCIHVVANVKVCDSYKLHR